MPSPWKGFFPRSPPTPTALWKCQLSFIHLLKFFGLSETPIPQEIPIHSVGEVYIFSGTAHSQIRSLITGNAKPFRKSTKMRHFKNNNVLPIPHRGKTIVIGINRIPTLCLNIKK